MSVEFTANSLKAINAAKLYAQQRENAAAIAFEDNAMDVTLSAADDAVADENQGNSRYVFVSVPYSAGWSATMDGKPVEILRANIGFMAVEADGGRHEIRFSYRTPGLDAGLLCSGAALAFIAAFEIGWARRRKARSGREGVSEKELVR